jgi:hypothetical protein
VSCICIQFLSEQFLFNLCLPICIAYQFATGTIPVWKPYQSAMVAASKQFVWHSPLLQHSKSPSQEHASHLTVFCVSHQGVTAPPLCGVFVSNLHVFSTVMIFNILARRFFDINNNIHLDQYINQYYGIQYINQYMGSSTSTSTTGSSAHQPVI